MGCREHLEDICTIRELLGCNGCKSDEVAANPSPLDDLVSLQFVLQEERRRGEWTDIYTADDGDAGEMILGIHRKNAKWPIRLIERRETFIAN